MNEDLYRYTPMIAWLLTERQKHDTMQNFLERKNKDMCGSWIDENTFQGKFKNPNSSLPCGCPKPWDFPDTSNCILNKPLYMVIPPEGVHLSCPCHSGGHHIYGNQVRC
jgi:hypothetical protein